MAPVPDLDSLLWHQMAKVHVVASCALILGCSPSAEIPGDKAQSQISIEPALVVIDPLDMGEIGSFNVSIKNLGDRELRIVDIVPSCSCTIVEGNRLPLSPGEWRVFSGEIIPNTPAPQEQHVRFLFDSVRAEVLVQTFPRSLIHWERSEYLFLKVSRAAATKVHAKFNIMNGPKGATLISEHIMPTFQTHPGEFLIVRSAVEAQVSLLGRQSRQISVSLDIVPLPVDQSHDLSAESELIASHPVTGKELGRTLIKWRWADPIRIPQRVSQRIAGVEEIDFWVYSAGKLAEDAISLTSINAAEPVPHRLVLQGETAFSRPEQLPGESVYLLTIVLPADADTGGVLRYSMHCQGLQRPVQLHSVLK